MPVSVRLDAKTESLIGRLLGNDDRQSPKLYALPSVSLQGRKRKARKRSGLTMWRLT
jgi:hypothetical protein